MERLRFLKSVVWVLFAAACAPQTNKSGSARVNFQLKTRGLGQYISSLNGTGGSTFEVSDKYCYALNITGDSSDLGNVTDISGAVCAQAPEGLGLVQGLFKKGDSISLSVPIGNKRRFDLIAIPKAALASGDCTGTFQMIAASRLSAGVKVSVGGVSYNHRVQLVATAKTDIVDGDNLVTLVAAGDDSTVGVPYSCNDVPRVSLSSVTNAVTSLTKAAFPVAGICTESGRSVVVSSGAVSAQATCADNGTWQGQIDLSTLSDGTVTLSATHTDIAGNTATSADLILSKSTVVPPTITGSIDDGSSSVSLVSTPTLSWTVSYSSPVSNFDHYEIAVGTGTSGAAQTNILNWTNVGSVNSYIASGLSLVNNGTYYASVRAVDAAGSASNALVGDGWFASTNAPSLSGLTITNTSPTNSNIFNLSVGVGSGTPASYCFLENDQVFSHCTTWSSWPATSVTVSNTQNSKVLSLWVKDASGHVSNRVDSNAVVLDTQVPQVTGLDSSTGDGFKSVGNTVYIQATFTEPVVVTGSPYITLNTSPARNAAYTSGSGSNILTFTYTVQASDNVAQLDVASASALLLNSGSIRDLAGNASSLSLPVAGSGNGFADKRHIWIDTYAPILSGSFSDGVATNSTTTSPVLTFTGSVSDPSAGSGLHHFETAVGTSPGAIDVVAWINVGTATSTALGHSFPSGSTYYASWRAVDKAGNASSVLQADGWVVDTTAPILTATSGINGKSFVEGITVTGTCGTATGDLAGVSVAYGTGVTGSSTTACSSGIYGLPISFPAGSFGPKTLTLAQGDWASNVTSITLNVNYKSYLHVGWIGGVSSAPTGGVTGCVGASGQTPGWCTGGIPTPYGSPEYGAFPSTVGAIVSDTNFIYVAIPNNNMVSRFNKVTGAFAGWLGNTHYVPGGACTSTGFTGQWCVGGQAQTGVVGDGSMSFPTGLALDGTTLYVVNSGHNAISKYNISGAFLGWIGNISTAPTGGDAGCSGATGFTPGWCVGGTSQAGVATDGSMTFGGFGYQLALGNGYLYVPDTNNHRVSRYDLATGAFRGWIGRVSANSPTMSDAATGLATSCSAVVAPAPTPGWCYGGTAWPYGTSFGSIANGSLYQPMAVTIDANYIYVADFFSRVLRFDINTGTFAGWIGKISSGVVNSTWDMSTSDFSYSSGTSEQGAFNGVYSIFASGGFLYVGESYNNRISRISTSTGAFAGWLGRIATTAGLSGEPGCSTAAVGDPSPAWCMGGTPDTSSSSTMLYEAVPGGVSSVYVEGSHLYYAGSYQSRIQHARTAP